MFSFKCFPDRFALGGGIYIGPWGVHIYVDFLMWLLSFEWNRERATPETSGTNNGQD